MKILMLEEHGTMSALRGITLSHGALMSRAFQIAPKLAQKDHGHNKFLESIMVWIDITAPRYWWQQVDTYRHMTKQSECYDNKTEVLTKKGWKLFADLSSSDKICTLNLNTNEIELQKPTRIYKSFYSGDMIFIQSKTCDLLVTPNHNILHESIKTKQRKFIKAEDIGKSIKRITIPKYNTWKGVHQEWFILPKISNTWKCGQYNAKHIKQWPEIKILMDDWLAFFGFWLAEGCITKTKKGYITQITQHIDSNYIIQIDEFMNNLPFKCHKYIDRGKFKVWRIDNRQLYDYLKQFGKSKNKFIPNWMLQLSETQLRILEHWLMVGDGSTKHNKYIYTTNSIQLADNIQEIFLKLGYNACIRYENKTYPVYRIYRHKTKYHHIQRNNISTIQYEGMIYCAEVPNHTLCIRRNGKTSWCGNSTMHTIMKGELTQDHFQKRDGLSDIPDATIEDLNSRIRNGDLEGVKINLPESFLQRRIICINYKCLRNILLQRYNHKLVEWRFFCKYILDNVQHPEFLPHLDIEV